MLRITEFIRPCVVYEKRKFFFARKTDFWIWIWIRVFGYEKRIFGYEKLIFGYGRIFVDMAVGGFWGTSKLVNNGVEISGT